MEFCLVCNGATGQLNTDTAEQAAGLDTSGPVGVSICNSNGCLVLRAIVKEEVLRVTVDWWERSFGQLGMGGGAPEVDAVVSCGVQISDGMFKTVKLALGGRGV